MARGWSPGGLEIGDELERGGHGEVGHRRRARHVQELGPAMALSLQGYYAILDVKGSSVDLPAALAHAARLLDAGPCCLQLRGKASGRAPRSAGSATPCGRCASAPAFRSVSTTAWTWRWPWAPTAVHLGQGDLPVAASRAPSRRRVARPLAIGLSTHDLAEARAAEADGADYSAFGPVFPTEEQGGRQACRWTCGAA